MDLTTITTGELLEELRKRHSRFIFVGKDVKDYNILHFGGYFSDAMGMARYAEKRLYDLWMKSQTTEHPIGD